MIPARIITTNKYSVVANVFEAASSNSVLILASATGVKQTFYKRFAEYLVRNNITVITFDYFGIGQSLEHEIKKIKCNAENWGNNDLESVIRYTIAKYPEHNYFLMGHSIGGQLIGLAPTAVKANKIILVAAQSGYWKFWNGISKFKMWFMWHVLFPVMIFLYGYLPSRKFSGMENLPKGVAEQWSKWSKNHAYLFAYVPQQNLHYSKINCPITSYSIDNDFYAPAEAVHWLTNKYNSVLPKITHLKPFDFAVKKIGHFDIFSNKFEHSLWPLLLKEIKSERLFDSS